MGPIRVLVPVLVQLTNTTLVKNSVWRPLEGRHARIYGLAHTCTRAFRKTSGVCAGVARGAFMMAGPHDTRLSYQTRGCVRTSATEACPGTWRSESRPRASPRSHFDCIMSACRRERQTGRVPLRPLPGGSIRLSPVPFIRPRDRRSPLRLSHDPFAPFLQYLLTECSSLQCVVSSALILNVYCSRSYVQVWRGANNMDGFRLKLTNSRVHASCGRRVRSTSDSESDAWLKTGACRLLQQDHVHVPS